MDENYKGAVVSVVENPTDGYDSSIDYDALNGETVSCAATPGSLTARFWRSARTFWPKRASRWIFRSTTTTSFPNNIVEDGQCDTNYFQHQPYLDDFNAEHGTHLVTVAGIHVEPYGHLRRQAGQSGTDRGLSRLPQSPCGDSPLGEGAFA